MDFPRRRLASNSPAPPDHPPRLSFIKEASSVAGGSPVPSCPGTPTSLALPMDPPRTISHSRRSSFGSSPAPRRSASPAPSMPLPAVKPMEASPRPGGNNLGVQKANLYFSETLTSFFRRLTFTADGSLLLTPAGQYQRQFKGDMDKGKSTYDVLNTVYIYTRGGIDKPPIAHLPGHKKPSVAVKCSPVFYRLRDPKEPVTRTKQITIDTSSNDGCMPPLPDPMLAARASSATPSFMDPPPMLPQLSDPAGPTSSPKPNDSNVNNVGITGPASAFTLPYRMVYAVATQDSVLLYDTQQQTPLCCVSNLHCATFTDLAWYDEIPLSIFPIIQAHQRSCCKC